jgi:hypothetical protein
MMTQTIGWGLASAMLAMVLGVASPGVVGIAGHEGVEVADLSELADGETRTFGSGEHTITATRNGEVITISIPDGDGDVAKTIDCKVGGAGGCYAFTADDTAGVKMIVVDGEGGDAIRRKIEVIKIGEGGDGVFAHHDASVFVMDSIGEGSASVEALIGPHGAHNMWVSHGGDKLVMKCPEGDTTMRLDKDEDRTFYCPQHNVELEEVKLDHIMRRIVIETDGDDDNAQ